MTSLILDFASTDGLQVPDLSAAYKAGMRVGVPRGVYGRPGPDGKPFRDPRWDQNKDRFAPAGMQRTAYLFLCFPSKNYSGTTPEPEVQAQAMFDYVKLTRGVDFPPVIDIEQESDVLTNAEQISWCNRAVVKLAELYGVMPIVYWSDRVYIEVLGNPTAAQIGPIGKCPQWIAKPWPWNTGTPVHLDGAAGYNPNTIEALGDATNWLWYQYQGDGSGMPGFTGYVDLSRGNVVRRGMKGTIVSDIQSRLRSIYPDLPVTGTFDAATGARVKDFQTSWKLTADEIVGNLTWAPLLWTPHAC